MNFRVVAVLLATLAGSCRPRATDVIVFHATSLTQPLGEIAERFERDHPGVHIRLEPSGSQVAARKIAEQGMAADVVAVADSDLIVQMLVPAHAHYSVMFATDEIVVAHKDHSLYTDEITTQNWTSVLLRPGVRLGRADADTAPLGYQTLLAWQLAESASAPGLSSALAAQCAKEHIATDEAELLAELESASVDYAFLYRSTAEDHHLKITALPPDVNLSRPDLAADYAKARVSVRMKRGDAPSIVPGAPITYGLTIPTSAPHPDAAHHFVAWILSDAGRLLLVRRGLAPVVPARCAPCDDLPAPLKALVSSAP